MICRTSLLVKRRIMKRKCDTSTLGILTALEQKGFIQYPIEMAEGLMYGRVRKN